MILFGTGMFLAGYAVGFLLNERTAMQAGYQIGRNYLIDQLDKNMKRFIESDTFKQFGQSERTAVIKFYGKLLEVNDESC